ncbi:hypothetical protein BaRGS_00033319, partial [Batillaria attramentaria]
QLFPRTAKENLHLENENEMDSSNSKAGSLFMDSEEESDAHSSGKEYVPDTSESDSGSDNSEEERVYPALKHTISTRPELDRSSLTTLTPMVNVSPESLHAAGLFTSTPVSRPAAATGTRLKKTAYNSQLPVPSTSTATSTCTVSASPSSPNAPHPSFAEPGPQTSGTCILPAMSTKLTVHVAVKKNGKRLYNKLQKCKFCEKLSTNLTKHLCSKHQREPEVCNILSKPKQSKERKLMLERIRNIGNFQHNCAVLKANEGILIPWRSPSEEVDPHDYIPCEFCLGFFLKKELWRHEENCKFRSTAKKGRKVISRSEGLLPSSTKCSRGLEENVLQRMASDGITLVAKTDSLITQFGEKLYQKHGHLPHRQAYIKQKLRELARLLVAIRDEDSGVTELKDVIHPSKFSPVVSAVKKLCEYEPLTNSYRNPSLALKLGHDLKKCAGILRSQALMAGDCILQKEAADFRDLCESDWQDNISSCALSTLETKKYNKPHVLPLTEDMKKVTEYIADQRAATLFELKTAPSGSSWHALAKIALANIILFNRRRSGEASRMLVSDYQSAKGNREAPEDDILSALSPLEKQLVNNFTRVEVRGKRGRRVPVLLTDTMCEEVEQLLALRDQVGVNPANQYLFARPFFVSIDHIEGHRCLREAVQHSGAKNPQDITSTKLRQHLATVTQLLNLNDHELEQVCGFLGHNISVHREYYRLPQDTYQLAKVSRLLLAAERGKISRFQGKSLDEIHMDEALEFSDSEEEGNECEDEEQHEPIDSVTASATESPAPGRAVHGAHRESAANKKPQRARDYLSSDQIKAVRKHFARHIEHSLVPKKAECLKILEKESLLHGKSWTKIKCSVRNEIEKRKRAVRKLQRR